MDSSDSTLTAVQPIRADRLAVKIFADGADAEELLRMLVGQGVKVNGS